MPSMQRLNAVPTNLNPMRGNAQTRLISRRLALVPCLSHLWKTCRRLQSNHSLGLTTLSVCTSLSLSLSSSDSLSLSLSLSLFLSLYTNNSVAMGSCLEYLYHATPCHNLSHNCLCWHICFYPPKTRLLYTYNL